MDPNDPRQMANPNADPRMAEAARMANPASMEQARDAVGGILGGGAGGSPAPPPDLERYAEAARGAMATQPYDRMARGVAPDVIGGPSAVPGAAGAAPGAPPYQRQAVRQGRGRGGAAAGPPGGGRGPQRPMQRPQQPVRMQPQAGAPAAPTPAAAPPAGGPPQGQRQLKKPAARQQPRGRGSRL
jgi:hypothetical protein